MKSKWFLLAVGLLAWPWAIGCDATTTEGRNKPAATTTVENEAAWSGPRRILLIRHAEKPPPEAMSVHLTEEGKKRARALVKLFEQSADRPEPFAKPDFLFATKNTVKSHRPNETIAELAKSLDLPVNDHIENDSFNSLAVHLKSKAKYSGKTVLVCWHHGNMSALAKALGVSDPPKDWKSTSFDRVWEIDYDNTGHATLKDLPQRLLPGDSTK